MKKNFTLILALTMTMLQLANARGIENKEMPKTKNSKKVIMGEPSSLSKLQFFLLSQQPGDTSFQAAIPQGCLVAFDSTFNKDSLNFGGNSADFNASPFGFGEDLSIDQLGKPFTNFCWGLPKVSDTINIQFLRASSIKYQLIVDATAFTEFGNVAYLFDRYLNTTTLVPLTSPLFYNFSSNANSVATYKNRFSIVFQSTALPIKNIALNTVLKNGTINLNWRTTGESNLSSFSVERSTDKIHFTSLTTIAAKNSPVAAYAYTDNSSAAGISYYRIKATSNTGEVTYSAISVINKNSAATVFGVYPNPVSSNTFNLKLANAGAGTYTLTIQNLLGQKISTQQVLHNGGSANYSLSIEKVIANGLYTLSIVSTTSNQPIYETSLLIKK